MSYLKGLKYVVLQCEGCADPQLCLSTCLIRSVGGTLSGWMIMIVTKTKAEVMISVALVCLSFCLLAILIQFLGNLRTGRVGRKIKLQWLAGGLCSLSTSSHNGCCTMYLCLDQLRE